MSETVHTAITFPDYIAKIIAAIENDTDTWSEVFFRPAQIADTPLEKENQLALRDKVIAEVQRLRPTWCIVAVEDFPTMAKSDMAAYADRDSKWQWLHINKLAMEG